MFGIDQNQSQKSFNVLETGKFVCHSSFGISQMDGWIMDLLTRHSVLLSMVTDDVTWMSCRLVSSVTEGLAIEKQVPSHGSRRVLMVSTPA